MSFAIPSLKKIVFESALDDIEMIPVNKGKTEPTDDHFIRLTYKNGRILDVMHTPDAVNIWNTVMAKINLNAQALNQIQSPLLVPGGRPNIRPA